MFLKHGGIFKHEFVANLLLSRLVKKNFENRIIVSEVMAKSLVSCFFDSRCSVQHCCSRWCCRPHVITVACPPAARVRLKVCSQRMNVTEVDWTDLQQVDPVTRRVHWSRASAAYIRLVIGCSVTRTVGAQSFRALESMRSQLEVAHSPVEWMCCEQSLTLASRGWCLNVSVMN